jgi:S-adenosylmethionine decarboxylase
LIDASQCDPAKLRDLASLRALFAELIATLELKLVAEPQWHCFPGEGGITGLALLAESHLAIHTFPERRFAALNVYCCRPRQAPSFERLLRDHLGSEGANIRRIERGEAT